MHKSVRYCATLPSLAGDYLPHVELAIDARYQVAVTCGAQAAIAFFAEDQAITLHQHLPASLACFVQQTRQSAAALGVSCRDTAKACTDAFVAGYLGRIQQELRIVRPPPSTPPRTAAAMY